MNRDDARFLEALGEVARKALLADESVALPGIGVVLVAHRASRQFSDDRGTVVTAPARELVFDAGIPLEQDTALEQAARVEGVALPDARVLWQNALNRFAADKQLQLPGVGDLFLKEGKPSCRFLPLLQHAVNAPYNGYVDLGLSRSATSVEHTDAHEREAAMANQVDYVDLVDRVIDEQDAAPTEDAPTTSPLPADPDSVYASELERDAVPEPKPMDPPSSSGTLGDSGADLTDDATIVDQWTPIEDVDSLISDLVEDRESPSNEDVLQTESADSVSGPERPSDQLGHKADHAYHDKPPVEHDDGHRDEHDDDRQGENQDENRAQRQMDHEDQGQPIEQGQSDPSDLGALDDVENVGFVALDSDFLAPADDEPTAEAPSMPSAASNDAGGDVSHALSRETDPVTSGAGVSAEDASDVLEDESEDVQDDESELVAREDSGTPDKGRERPRAMSRRRDSGGVIVAVAAIVVVALGLIAWQMGWLGGSASDAQAVTDAPVVVESVENQGDNAPAGAADANAVDGAVGAAGADNAEAGPTSVGPTEPTFQRGAIDLNAGGFTIIVSSKETLADAIRDAMSLGERGEPVDVLEAEVNGQIRYRVAVGQYRTFSLASRALNQAAAQLPEGSWIGRIE